MFTRLGYRVTHLQRATMKHLSIFTGFVLTSAIVTQAAQAQSLRLNPFVEQKSILAAKPQITYAAKASRNLDGNAHEEVKHELPTEEEVSEVNLNLNLLRTLMSSEETVSRRVYIEHNHAAAIELQKAMQGCEKSFAIIKRDGIEAWTTKLSTKNLALFANEDSRNKIQAYLQRQAERSSKTSEQLDRDRVNGYRATDSRASDLKYFRTYEKYALLAIADKQRGTVLESEVDVGMHLRNRDAQSLDFADKFAAVHAYMDVFGIE
jgi:hypothetical protein